MTNIEEICKIIRWL